MNGAAIKGQDSLYASATLDKATNKIILKVVNASASAQNQTILLEGAKK